MKLNVWAGFIPARFAGAGGHKRPGVLQCPDRWFMSCFLITTITLGLLPWQAHAAGGLIYRYIEGESYEKKSWSGEPVRDKDFTPFLTECSRGKVVVIPPSHSLDYNVSKLPPGTYAVFVKSMAFASAPSEKAQADVNSPEAKRWFRLEAWWNGDLVGYLKPDETEIFKKKKGIFMAWFKAGTLKVEDGEHTLRLQVDKEGFGIPHPDRAVAYVDVILLTNDPQFVPDDRDQDYESIP